MSTTLMREINRLQRILAQREKLAKEEGNFELKRDTTLRRRLLSDIALKDDTPVGTPTLFLAYSVTGKIFVSRVAARCDELGMEVVTGFDESVREYEVLLNGIMRAIQECSLFLGIWTPEYFIQVEGETRPNGVPSVWMLVELGIAVAFAKPFRLLIDSRIHPDFYTRIWGGKPHYVFDSADFGEKCEECLKYLGRRYHELYTEKSGSP